MKLHFSNCKTSIHLLLSIFVLLAVSACVVIPPPLPSPYNRGVEFYDQGRLAEAIEQYQLALRQNPNDTFSKYNLAVVYQDQEKFDAAVRLYHEILAAHEDTNSRINLAAIYHAQGKDDPAIDELRKAMDANRDNPNPASILGEYLEQKNQLPDAEHLYAQALKIDPRHAVSHYRLGRLLLKQNQAVGIQHLLEAVELEPQAPRYLEALGNEYEREKKPLEAIHALERLSVLKPDRVDVYIKLGDLYRKENFFKEAVNRYWTALALENDNTYVHRALKELFDTLNQAEQDWLLNNKGQGAVAKNPQ